jgi:hypothetical protein
LNQLQSVAHFSVPIDLAELGVVRLRPVAGEERLGVLHTAARLVE